MARKTFEYTATTLYYRIKTLEQSHGGLRALSRHLNIDVAYLKRLRDGKKTNPSDKILDKLGLARIIIYVPVIN